MNEIIIPEWTPLLVSEWEKLYVSKELVELATTTKNDVLDILTHIPVWWVARSEEFFRKYEIWNYWENYEVISRAWFDVKIKFNIQEDVLHPCDFDDEEEVD